MGESSLVSKTATQDEILDLVLRMEQAPEALKAHSIDGLTHGRLLAAARQLVAALETPETELMNIAKAPVANAVLRTAFKINLLEKFDDSEVTASELASRTNVDPLLLVRIMRTLVSLGIFIEPRPEVYTHSVRSKTLTNVKIRAVVRGMAETATTMSSLPEYLSSINYESPADHQPSLFGYARDTEKTMFEWLETQPEQRRIFADFQSATSENSHHRLKPFLQEVLSQTHMGSEVAFVDVGGGRGATLREVCRTLSPPPTGRVVLQDLPKVVEGLGTEDGVEAMPYSFLDPQPVKGATIYFFRHILHNWPDTVCHQILKNTISAMSPNSRIIMIDMVIPNRHPSV
ncbi:S-adenosyl-L-methionine-dependent methyltransferase [Aspergillus steynii IBT 23096]|uniref:S-adenosyl-L-methionine-dependent methyltransferase n=1 Tax=Aspergillus steynii IBT 23096 TaxID=1392250 RepID=A0A2I2GMC4_9EURO|nr:S-adenosyl-L-methionine-dependent methyltransferase [Aspergillus steynii IBT 23096]PLB54026.1 S-adenosyl-L-methionine-dependent methyltransferase [Aspergillus steynii IBT 23096]